MMDNQFLSSDNYNLQVIYTCCKTVSIKPGFHLDFFCLLLLVLVFRTNKTPKRAMQCSNRNIYKKPKQATKGICLFWFLRKNWFYLKNKNEQQKAAKGKWKHSLKTKTSNKKQQRAFFVPIFTHSHQFRTNKGWLTSRTMKNQREQECTTKSNKVQQKAKEAIENQNEQHRANTLQMETRLWMIMVHHPVISLFKSNLNPLISVTLPNFLKF